VQINLLLLYITKINDSVKIVAGYNGTGTSGSYNQSDTLRNLNTFLDISRVSPFIPMITVQALFMVSKTP
jgi:hypothetical protein